VNQRHDGSQDIESFNVLKNIKKFLDKRPFL